jgi:hypothetical protein
MLKYEEEVVKILEGDTEGADGPIEQRSPSPLQLRISLLMCRPFKEKIEGIKIDRTRMTTSKLTNIYKILNYSDAWIKTLHIRKECDGWYLCGVLT